MSQKINLLELARAQLATFSGYTPATLIRDLLTFVVLPIGVGVLSFFFAPAVYNVSGMLTGASVFAGLLVALLVNVFEFGVKVRRDEGIRPEERLAVTVDELMANASWTVVSSLAFLLVAAVSTAAQEPDRPLAPYLVGIIAALGTYVVLNVLMVISRIWTAHEEIKQLPPPKPSER